MSNIPATEADVLRCGYDVGFFDKTDVANWADRQIEKTEDPSAQLLDLAMIRRTHPIDVMSLLRGLGSTQPKASIQTQLGFIGLLLARQKITTQLAIRGLWGLLHEPGITQEQQSQIYALDDGYDCAVAGTYGSMNDVERELCDFVSPYSELLAQQYPHLIPPVK